jgi:hypothetical protein
MNKKLLGILAGVALLASFAAVLPGALADNNKNTNGGNDGGGDKTRSELKAIGSTLEVHIYDNGAVLVRGAKVTAVSGNTISATTALGGTNLNWTVSTDSSTQFVGHSGGQAGVAAISVGDFVSFNGNLVASTAGLTVNAKTLKDWSGQAQTQMKNASFIGKVVSLGSSSFVLAAEEHGNVTVNVIATTAFMKGDANAAFGDIHVGDKVLASGIFNNTSLALDASNVKIYVDKNVEQHTFEGTLKAIAGTTAPTSFTLTSANGADLTVNVPVGISVVNKLYLAAALSDFAVGDKVRVWGLEVGTTVDATVVRDTNLPR